MAAAAQIDLTREGAFVGLRMPMILAVPPMSDEEFIALSRRQEPYQLEVNARGELEIMSPVGFEGGWRELRVGTELTNWADQHGGFTFSSQAALRLPDTSVRMPDASWVPAEQWRSLTRDERRRFGPICPPFLIEILPETDSRTTLEAKMQMWMDNGAHLAWLIDPFAREVIVYAAGQQPSLLSAPEHVTADTVVPGFTLYVARLWSEA